MTFFLWCLTVFIIVLGLAGIGADMPLGYFVVWSVTFAGAIALLQYSIRADAGSR